jgi:PAS domain S-box-containing protein
MGEGVSAMESFDRAVLEHRATWWQMELPSGDVFFGEAKAEMLGFPESDFKNYSDFTKLLHPDDYEKAMQAMRDHMDGKEEFYETVYRIKNSEGEYIKFYDCGQIVERKENGVVVMGFVWKVDEDEDVLEQMKSFKEMISHGEPSIIELVAKIR